MSVIIVFPYVSLNLPHFSCRPILDPMPSQCNACLFSTTNKSRSNTEDIAKIIISGFSPKKNSPSDGQILASPKGIKSSHIRNGILSLEQTD